MHKTNSVVLGLGTNLGSKAQNLAQALKIISGFCKVVSVSSVYKTRSLLKDSQDDYFNLCARIETDFSETQLLQAIKNIEKVMGRTNTGRWYTRIIDIDIIDFNNHVFQSDQLSIPHAEMENRSFVLFPLQEIYPDYKHPIHCRTIDDMVNLIKDNLGITKLGVCTWLL